ncbi:MAG TPA: L,D-transpeptidase [Dehalococcoidia bacterium]|nr:L,D-transpeptidase [Dehalococcoidia bacterium]
MKSRFVRLLGLSFVLCLLALTGCGGSRPAVNETAGEVIITPIETTPVPEVSRANAPDTPDRPREGRWIDVDVSRLEVQLMEGDRVLETIGPVAVGAEIDTGAYESTQTGLFAVYVKTEALTYDAPYDTYISHWIGFDSDKDNGFHSFLKSEDGAIVDAATGRISNGCIRTGAAEAIFAFAEVGMPVYVHA